MAANIGGQSATFVKDQFQEQKERLNVWERPGVSGYGAHLLADADSAFSFRVILYDTLANINTWFTAIQAMKGTIVTIENDLGNTSTDCLVSRVSRPRITVARTASLPTTGFRVQIQVSGVVT